mmetsp:Transcript_41308/g.97037  ORF Transcript_41308/g.97037 Transcript_41308/m.97037 type:complete len:211 (+) Transcript_41308:747-1379(+)
MNPRLVHILRVDRKNLPQSGHDSISKHVNVMRVPKIPGSNSHGEVLEVLKAGGGDELRGSIWKGIRLQHWRDDDGAQCAVVFFARWSQGQPLKVISTTGHVCILRTTLGQRVETVQIYQDLASFRRTWYWWLEHHESHTPIVGLLLVSVLEGIGLESGLSTRNQSLEEVCVLRLRLRVVIDVTACAYRRGSCQHRLVNHKFILRSADILR